MRAYLSGPMRGLPRHNFDAFHAAEARLQQWGWTVHSPARYDESLGFDPDRSPAEQGFDVQAALRHDVQIIATWADAVIVLPGWENSEGARLEVAVAQACGLPVMNLDHSPVTTRCAPAVAA